LRNQCAFNTQLRHVFHRETIAGISVSTADRSGEEKAGEAQTGTVQPTESISFRCCQQLSYQESTGQFQSLLLGSAQISETYQRNSQASGQLKLGSDCGEPATGAERSRSPSFGSKVSNATAARHDIVQSSSGVTALGPGLQAETTKAEEFCSHPMGCDAFNSMPHSSTIHSVPQGATAHRNDQGSGGLAKQGAITIEELNMQLLQV
jgi:hypothetical protein